MNKLLLMALMIAPMGANAASCVPMGARCQRQTPNDIPSQCCIGECVVQSGASVGIGVCMGSGGGGTSCTGSNCVSTSWAAKSTGYETRKYRWCSNSTTCSSRDEYRCAAGYYGTSTNGTSGCTRCPSSGGVYGNSVVGSTSITSCYLPSGTSGSDSTGSFTYTGNCYYSN